MGDPILLKRAEEIQADIIAEVFARTGISDANLGAIVRTLAYAVGQEIEGAYLQVYWATVNAYILKATWTALDNRGADFGVTRRSATKAVGTARFTASDTVTVPAGTQIAAPATTARDRIVFVTTAIGSRVGAGTLDIPIQAVVAGDAGNLASSTITEMVSAVTNITAVTNPGATLLGTDQEDDDTYRGRIIAHIEGLSKGTPVSIIDGALDFTVQTVTLKNALPNGQNYMEVTEDLDTIPISIAATGKLAILDSSGSVSEVVYYTGINTAVSPQRITGLTRGQESTSDVDHEAGLSVEEWIPAGRGRVVTGVVLVETPGNVDVYIDDGTTLGPHDQLKNLVQYRLRGDGTARDPGYRPAGVTLSGYKVTIVQVNVTAVVQGNVNTDEIEAAIEAYLNTRSIGEDIYGSAIACIIQDQAGVEKVVSLVIQGNTYDGAAAADLAIGSTSVARAGTISVT